MRLRTYRLLLFLGLLASSVGWAEQAPPSGGAASAPQVRQQDVTVAAEPYLDEERIQRTFHKLRLPRHITPVRVTIRNDRAEPIRIITDSIRIIDPVDTQYRALPIKEILQEAQRAKAAKGRMPIPIPTPVPLPRGRSGGAKDIRDLEAALRSHELRDRLIAPHTEEYGFLFFRIIGGSKTWAGSRLYIPEIRTMKTGDRLMFFEIELKTAN